MLVQDMSSPDRGSAAWIERYATGLLSARPDMPPLEAVRLAMLNACGDRAPARGAGPSPSGAKLKPDPR